MDERAFCLLHNNHGIFQISRDGVVQVVGGVDSRKEESLRQVRRYRRYHVSHRQLRQSARWCTRKDVQDAISKNQCTFTS